MIRGEIEDSKVSKCRKLIWDFSKESVASEVENLDPFAISNLRRDFIKEMVVGEGELLELGKPSDRRGQEPVEPLRSEDDSGDSDLRRVAEDSPLAGDSGQEAGGLTVDSEVFHDFPQGVGIGGIENSVGAGVEGVGEGEEEEEEEEREVGSHAGGQVSCDGGFGC